jgi:hypothetical protein
MSAKIFKNPIDVANRLEQLGVTRDNLFEVVDAMISARADCTTNDPPGAPGWSSWRMGTRRLREVMMTQDDWEKDEIDQISCVQNRNLGIRIAVANTDDATGLDLDNCIPQNRSKKGVATDRVVQANQMSFMEVLDASLKVVRLKLTTRASGPTITWYLCTYCEGDEVRAELSCPAGLDNGFFTEFIERILIIGPEDGDDIPVRRRGVDDDDSGSEFDVPVTRKKE